MITCLEKCIYECEGLCTLKEVSEASKTPIKDCPFFVEKDKKKKAYKPSF